MKTFIAVAMLVGGCTGSSNYWVVYSPAAGQTTQTRAAAIQHAIIAITDAGREVETSDAATGVVVSKWFTPDGMMSGESRFRVRATIDDAQHFEVVALCQQKNMTGSGWDDCGEKDKRPRFVVETVEKIAAALH